ncbi:MAG: flagellar basal body-associated FliL family protein [Pseudomonadales bacterium]
MQSFLRRCAVFLLLATTHSLGVAEDNQAQYIDLKPAFVTNYGSNPKLQYIKVEISVRVETLDDVALVERHLPYLRNNLVLLLSQQSDEDVGSAEGRQQLRVAALEEVQKVMQDEEGNKVVSDVLFNNFIVQS